MTTRGTIAVRLDDGTFLSPSDWSSSHVEMRLSVIQAVKSCHWYWEPQYRSIVTALNAFVPDGLDIDDITVVLSHGARTWKSPLWLLARQPLLITPAILICPKQETKRARHDTVPYLTVTLQDRYEQNVYERFGRVKFALGVHEKIW